MVVHLSSAGKGIVGSVGIELCQQLLGRCETQCQQQRMSPVVIGAPVARRHRPGHGHLKQFFAIVRNAKFGTAGEHVPAD